jgi:two-component system phosphate regulon sensor histidine kinase PhoR
MAATLRARDARLSVTLAPGLPAVIGDADQLQQVLHNLVDNAVKYGRSPAEIRIVARSGDRPGLASPMVDISVVDNGEGIERTHLARLTERFYRIDAGRSRRLGGTGLGLAIVKHIVKRHRGHLTIDSEIGKGSVFTVSLPAAEVASGGDAKPGSDQS